MVLDEPKETDEVFRTNGLTMLMDKELHAQTRDVTIDFGMQGCGQGFRLTSEVPLEGSSGSCCGC
jgi:Fe-S cluster assembly iron-binding protein IscA